MSQKHSKEELLYLARLAEQSERYDEMVEYASSFAKMEGELNIEERNILSVAFKNVVGSRRAAWRVLSSIAQKEEKKGNASHVEKVGLYKQTIEKELRKLCDDILTLLDKHLIPSSPSDEAKVFYLKMKGDYLRYISEFSAGDDKGKASDNALSAYQSAQTIAQEKLSSTHPIRLGLALNFSVFYYEILQQPEKACEMAKKAFDDAITDLDNVNDDSYKDSTLIMQLLRDNLTLWTSDMPDDETPEGGQDNQ